VIRVALAGWLGLGPGLASGEEGPGARVDPVEAPVVVDATGQVVGPVVGAHELGFAMVRLRAGGFDAGVLVFHDRLVSPVGAQYESADCSGDPLIPIVPVQSLVPLADLTAVGAAGEILVGVGEIRARVIASEWEPLESPPACEPVAPPETEVVRATAVLPTAFVPPFRLR
jgi:hypothetical protein